jgi:AcrR family transcriptional regulator
MSPLSLPVKERRAAASPGARRKLAIEAARAIACEGGYEAVTMGEVARRSGVGRATLYRYFSSKDQLLVEVSLDFNVQLREELRVHPPRGETAAERLTDVFSRVLEAVAREPKLLAATLRAFFADDPVVRERVPELRRFGGTFVDAGLGGVDAPNAPEIARVLGPLSLAMTIRISSGHCSLDEAIEEIRCAARLLVRE